MVAIVNRAGWGATRGVPGGRHVAPSARRWFVAHWPVMGARDERAWMRDIDSIHPRQGWGVIGYNFGIGMSGTIYEGAGRDVRGIHEPSRNTDGWGVVFLQPSTPQGAVTGPLTQAARNAGRALYEHLCGVAGRRLGMGFHGQFSATACPGPDVRGWVQAGMPATGAPPGPGAGAPPPPPEEPASLMLDAGGFLLMERIM